MKHRVKKIVSLLLICVLSFSGCMLDGEIEYYGIVTTDFDIEEAIEIISKGDKVVAEMSLNDVITRDEYGIFFNQLVDIYVNNPYGFELFFPTEHISGLEKGTILETYVRQDVFCPTIFHEGMEILEAYVDTETYEAEIFSSSFLVIEMIYTGENELFEDFQKTYVYRKNYEDGWDFYAIGGNAVYIGDEYPPNVLPFKENSGIGIN